MAYDLRSQLEATLDMTGKPESLYVPKVGIYKAYLTLGSLQSRIMRRHVQLDDKPKPASHPQQ
jgi:hypothetical protein